jgi:hypothetical protein
MGSDFETFYAAYPKHQGVAAARKKWATLHKAGKLPDIEVILEAIEVQKQSKKWTDGYIPQPARWLNEGCWLDEVPGHTKRIEEERELAEQNKLAKQLAEKKAIRLYEARVKSAVEQFRKRPKHVQDYWKRRVNPMGKLIPSLTERLAAEHWLNYKKAHDAT